MWRPITLLNTIKKNVENIDKNKFFYLIKHHNWFCFTNKNQIRQINKNCVKVFYQTNSYNYLKHEKWQSRDVVHVFLMINHERLLHNFWKKKVFEWIIKWTTSFVKNKRIILLLAQHTSKYLSVRMNFSQDLLMFFILYLFFNADLLKLLNRLNVKITIINFVNNVNLLVFEKFIEKNCMTLN